MTRHFIWRLGWLVFGISVGLSVLLVGFALSHTGPGSTPQLAQRAALDTAVAALGLPTPTVARPESAVPLEEAERLYARSQLSAALKEYARAVELDPQNARAYALWGRALVVWGNPSEAVAKLDRAVELEPTHAEFHAYRCFALDWSNRYAEAIRACQRGIELEPNSALAHAFLAEAFADAGQVEQALAVGRKAVALDERSPDVQRGFGYALQAASHVEDAEQAFRRAIAAAPEVVHYRLSLARFLRETGRHPSALAELQQLVDRQSDNPQLFVELGLTVYQQKKYAEAVPYFEEALRLGGPRATPHTYLGWSYYLQGSYERALPHFEGAVRLDPKRVEALAGLGWTHLALKRPAEARDAFTRVLAINPNHESAKKGLAAVQ